jgi:hypothetical protein
MAERIIQIDDDWKRQAQEEKRKLAEQQASAKPAQAPEAPGKRSRREMPEASFGGLVATLMTQASMYLGEAQTEDGEPMVDIDTAKYFIDTLGVLEARTRGNLDAEEQALLDASLYDLRSRYVSIVSQTLR